MAEVIGLSGFAGSGKDYIYLHHLRPQSFYQISLAWHFKADLIGKGALSFEQAFVSKPPKVRTMLQLVGTELGRNVYGEKIWCDILKAWIEIFEYHWGIDRFCIPDVRFWNEIDFIHNDLGGKIIRVKAPGRAGSTELDAKQRAHPSEAEMLEMDDSVFDAILFNDENDPPVETQIKKIFKEFGYEYW